MRLEADGDESLSAQAAEVRERVLKWTGIPVSIGLAPTKTLAKVANRVAKRVQAAQGVLPLIEVSEQTSALDETPVEEVWGVGPSHSKLLRAAGIDTARKLKDADRRWVRRRMTVVGARIVEELRGVPCLALEQCPPAKKSVTCSRSFGAAVESIGELREAVAVYASRAAERMRRHGMAASVVTVFVNTGRFSAGPQYSNAATLELGWPLRTLERVYRPGYAYRKAEVMLTHLVPADRLSMRLYGDEGFERSRRVARAMDEINRRHGRDTVRFGAALPGGRWATKAPRRSPAYTTRLAEVLRIA